MPNTGTPPDALMQKRHFTRIVNTLGSGSTTLRNQLSMVCLTAICESSVPYTYFKFSYTEKQEEISGEGSKFYISSRIE